MDLSLEYIQNLIAVMASVEPAELYRLELTTTLLSEDDYVEIAGNTWTNPNNLSGNQGDWAICWKQGEESKIINVEANA